MREIKFRAWNKKKQVMLDYAEIDTQPLWFLNNREERDEFIIMQYTGLKDKNGTEIYEGDIVKKCKRVHEVKFYEGCYIIAIMTDDGIIMHLDLRHDLLNMEVIGNIYENPELLN